MCINQSEQPQGEGLTEQREAEIRECVRMQHRPLFGDVQDLLAELTRVRQQLAEAQRERRHFPIMGGPSVPWHVMEPHDRQARKNHSGQSLKELAERGGLSPDEAWCVVQDMEYPRDRTLVEPYVVFWRNFADGYNMKVAALESRLQAAQGFIDHKSDCAVFNPHPLDKPGYSCDCGYDELAAALKGEPRDE